MTTDTLERTDAAPKPATSDLEIHGIISAYLYYLDFGGGNTVRSEAIYEYYDRPGATVNRDNLVLQLATNAYTGGGDPIPYTEDHQYFMVRRKSYLIIVAANAPAIDPINPIEFEVNGIAGPKNDGRHTFLNIRHSDLTFGSSPQARLQIVTCENHMQRKSDLAHPNPASLEPKEWEDFTFALQFNGAAARLVGSDSGGTNMGPPVPPPALYSEARGAS